jgi:hypothetical protein
MPTVQELDLLYHLGSILLLTNNSVAAVRASGFRVSVFRFHIYPPFRVYNLPLQRESVLQ